MSTQSAKRSTTAQPKQTFNADIRQQVTDQIRYGRILELKIYAPYGDEVNLDLIKKNYAYQTKFFKRTLPEIHIHEVRKELERMERDGLVKRSIKSTRNNTHWVLQDC